MSDINYSAPGLKKKLNLRTQRMEIRSISEDGRPHPRLELGKEQLRSGTVLKRILHYWFVIENMKSPLTITIHFVSCLHVFLLSVKTSHVTDDRFLCYVTAPFMWLSASIKINKFYLNAGLWLIYQATSHFGQRLCTRIVFFRATLHISFTACLTSLTFQQ